MAGRLRQDPLPGHEIGFSPDGKFLVMMNNLRENNCSIFSCADPDPTKWRKVAHVEDPLWRGKYPNPFHMVFSMDSSKLYLSIQHPSPAYSGLMVIDTKTWTILKEIQGIGPDLRDAGHHLRRKVRADAVQRLPATVERHRGRRYLHRHIGRHPAEQRRAS